jgi:hypothetical protein
MMKMNHTNGQVVLLLLWQLLLCQWNNVDGASSNINPIAPMKRFSKRIWNKISGQSSNSYTPLVFFCVPPGLIPEVDAMEKAVQKVEDELNVRVERLDILRNPASNAALAVLTSRTPPFLYHRESLQVVHIPPSIPAAAGGDGADEESKKKKRTASSIYIDQDRIRAWAQGRYLPASFVQQAGGGGRGANKKPIVLSQEDNSIDQNEILEDMALTDLQRKGKKAIAERTREQAAGAKE